MWGGGDIHSGAPSQAKRDTIHAEKEEFAYKFAKKWRGTCHLCPRFLRTLQELFHEIQISPIGVELLT